MKTKLTILTLALVLILLTACSPLKPVQEKQVVICPTDDAFVIDKSESTCPEIELELCKYETVCEFVNEDYIEHLETSYHEIEYYNPDTTLIIENVFTSGTRGDSMRPAIHINHTIIYKYCPKGKCDLQVGDIISYHKGNKTISHRIIEITDDYVVARGDNNNWQELVLYEDIRAVAIGELYTDKKRTKSRREVTDWY